MTFKYNILQYSIRINSVIARACAEAKVWYANQPTNKMCKWNIKMNKKKKTKTKIQQLTTSGVAGKISVEENLMLFHIHNYGQEQKYDDVNNNTILLFFSLSLSLSVISILSHRVLSVRREKKLLCPGIVLCI